MTALATARPPAARRRFEALFERTGDLRAMAVLRILLGPITLLHLAPFLRDARAGIDYDDHFWEPYASWLPRPPGGLWVLLIWVGAASAVLMTFGILTRLTTATTFAVVAGNLLLSQTHFRHNRTFLAILLGGLALVPSGSVLSFDAWWRRARGHPALSSIAPVWPLILLQAQVSLVYLASGISKLVDPSWHSGLVLWDRVVRYQHVLDGTPVPAWGVDVLTWRPLYLVVAPVAILIEVGVGLALWSDRTRLAALWIAIAVHISIELSARVEVFRYAAIAALTIWVTPSARDRVVRLRTSETGPGWLAVAVRTLDWFGRFRLEEAVPGEPGVLVVDRDGRTVTGRTAVRLVLTRLPATFPVALLLPARR